MIEQPVEQPVQAEHYSPVLESHAEEQGKDFLIDIPIDMQEELLLQHLEEQMEPEQPIQRNEVSESETIREIQALIPWEAPPQEAPQAEPQDLRDQSLQERSNIGNKHQRR